MHVECCCTLPHDCWCVCVLILGVTALCLCHCDTECRIIVGAGDGTVEVVRELDSVAPPKSAGARKVRTPSVPQLQAVSNWALLPEYCAWENVHLALTVLSLDSPKTRIAFCSIADTQSRRMRWAGHVEYMGERRGVYRVLMGKPEGKWALGRPRLRWEDSIKIDLQEVGCGGMDWIELAQDRDMWWALVNVVMSIRVI
jgi:hypothetical protein